MTPDKLPSHDRPRITTRLAVSAPAGLAMLLLAGAVAFGHSSGFFASAPSTEASEAGTPVADDKPDVPAAPILKPDPTAKAAASEKTAQKKDSAGADALALALRTPKPAPESSAEPKPEPEKTALPQPAKVPQPTAKPAPVAPPTTTLALSAQLGEHVGKVILSWSAYAGEGFEYYKLVRSYDGDPTWPTSGSDELIAAIGNRDETWAKDRPACGTTAFYRVFAVRHSEAGYVVLAPSNVASAVTACPPPPPATVAIGLAATFAEGQVNLSWGACASEYFNAYKVVRSQTNTEPTYPENEGTELIGVIGDPNQTWFADASVQSGQTWFYRVLARADAGGGNYIACASNVVSVTIP